MFEDFRRRLQNKRELRKWRETFKRVANKQDLRNQRDGKNLTSEEAAAAFAEYDHYLVSVTDQIARLEQEELLRRLRSSPLEVPEEYWRETEDRFCPVLTPRGVKWARYELKKLRNAEIEFWFKLVLPVLSLILSVIALVRSGHGAH